MKAKNATLCLLAEPLLLSTINRMPGKREREEVKDDGKGKVLLMCDYWEELREIQENEQNLR